jgi:DNA-binding GntR family transcriptional regulator
MSIESLLEPFSFSPVKAPTLKDGVADHIRTAILTGGLAPGTRIVESKLAREMTVAQTTVREAIQDLANQGLLVKRVNRESLVRKLTVADLNDLFMLRMDLEGLAVELAHSRIDEKTLLPLYETVEQMRRSARIKNLPQFYRVDIAFHQRLSQLAKNEFLERALVPLSIGPIAFVLAGSGFPLDGNYVEVADNHAQILDSFKEETPKGARRVMETMLQSWHEMQMRAFLKTAMP